MKLRVNKVTTGGETINIFTSPIQTRRLPDLKTHTLVHTWMPLLRFRDICLIALRRVDFDGAGECLSCGRFQAPGVRANVNIIVVPIDPQRKQPGQNYRLLKTLSLCPSSVLLRGNDISSIPIYCSDGCCPNPVEYLVNVHR